MFSTSPEVFDRMPIIFAKLSVRVTGADKAGKVVSTLSENFGKVICGTHELLLRVGSG